MYADAYQTGRYIYRGANPNNYITFNNELWRILSVEADGKIKIIKNESIGDMYWDAANTRSSSTSTYCTNASTGGCNAWAATSNLVGTPSAFTVNEAGGNAQTGTYYTGTVTQDASLNTYLNTAYYNSLSSTAQAKVVNGDFYVGAPGDSGLSCTNTLLLNSAGLENNVIELPNAKATEESNLSQMTQSYANCTINDYSTELSNIESYVWNGKVGLINILEYLDATTSTTLTDNWLNNGTNFWTISPFVYEQSYTWFIAGSNNNGKLMGERAYDYGVRPVLNLTSDIRLSGAGTSASPYTIN